MANLNEIRIDVNPFNAFIAEISRLKIRRLSGTLATLPLFFTTSTMLWAHLLQK